MSDSPLIINLLSGPRNVSTALMYSFAQRSDCSVVDEPLYGHYLKQTSAPQPHRDELLKILETDAASIVEKAILHPPSTSPIHFVKNMAHHLIEMDLDWLEAAHVQSVFLIRDPEQMLPSLVNQIEAPTLRDAAYESQARWFETLSAAGQAPAVIDAKELLLHPGPVLKALCERLKIPFEPEMLNWEAGPRKEDGAWAPYWYHNVHLSTEFGQYHAKTDPFPDRLIPLLDECRPHYETLLAHSIKA